MVFEDTFQAFYVLVLGNTKRWVKAGLANGCTDIPRFLGIGAGGAILYNHTFSVLSALTVLAILAGSIAGAGIGTFLDKKVEASDTRSS